MKALPQARAGAIFHIGIIAGKLNGVIPAHDAQRLAHRVHVDAGAGAVGELALQQVRRADAELDHLEAALHVARGVGQGLAVLAAQRLGQLVHVAVEEARRTPSSPAPGAAGWSPPTSAAPRAARVDRCVDLRAEAQGDPRLHLAGGRVEDIGDAPGAPGTRLPSMKCPSSCIAAFLPSDPSSGTLSPKAGQCSGKFVVPVLRIRPPGGGGAAVAVTVGALRGAGDDRGDSRTAVTKLVPAVAALGRKRSRRGPADPSGTPPRVPVPSRPVSLCRAQRSPKPSIWRFCMAPAPC